jgi:hypothetical protein
MNRVMNKQRLRTSIRLTFGNPVSLGYLALVLAATVFVAVDTLFVAHEDASFAGVWLFFLAAPTVFAFFVGSSLAGSDGLGPAWFVYLALVVSVVVQAFVLGWFTRLVRRGGRGPAAHPQGA